ncbi:MAG: flavin reductase family protein [Hyphomicrobiaceae bacterium]
MKRVPAGKAYRFLEAGPIVLVATSRDGKPNVMTMGFHMMVSHDPPLIGCVIGPWDHSYAALRETRECVIAIPTVDLAGKVVDIGNCSGSDFDKLAHFGLSTLKASKVTAPLLPDCLVNLECRVADDTLAQRHDLWILEALAIWVDPARKERRTLHHNGDGTFNVDGRLIDLRDRMVKWKYLQD